MRNMESLKHFPIEVFYGFIAIAGGVARYLNGYVNGQRFKLSIFFASAFVAGFSGYMFALLGVSMNMPQGFLFMMSGVGGFFGEQTMQFVLEAITKRTHNV